MYLSTCLLPTHNVKENSTSFEYLESAGYAKTITPGCIGYLPLGLSVLEQIQKALAEICQRNGYWKISMPLLQKRELWEESGRAAKYPGLLCETTIGENGRYVINPTQEEAVLDLLRQVQFKKSDLPLRMFQISDRVRNEIRPAHGLIRSRCFTLADLYSISENEAEAEREALLLESIMKDFFAWLGFPMKQGIYFPSTMGVSVYSYWTPSTSKQCIISLCSNCDSSFRPKTPLLTCPACNEESIELVEGAEIGDVMRSHTSLSAPLGVHPMGNSEPVHIAMTGIGTSRVLQLIAAEYHDERGLTLPIRIAPFDCHIVADRSRAEQGVNLHGQLTKAGRRPLLDNREINFGRKLIDTDLIGMPIQILLGKKTEANTFELRFRRTGLSFKGKLIDIHSLLSKVCDLEKSEV